MKKLLLATLAVFTFVGLTGCANEKKLTAEEAKTEIKAAQENTAKALKETKGVKVDTTTKFEATVSAKNIKVQSSLGALIPEIKTAKVSANATLKGGFTVDLDKMKAKATASEDISASANYTMGDKTEKFSVASKGNGEAYVVKGEDKVNVYAKGELNNDIKVPEDYKALIDAEAYKKLSGKINLKFDLDEDDEDEKSIDEVISTIDFDTIITDWTIFKKKGSTLTADTSNLAAFGVDAEAQAELAKMGLTLKISKFEIGLNKDKAITSFDFNVSLKGDVDLSKQDIDKDDIVDFISTINPGIASSLSTVTISGMTGTVSIDTAFNFGLDIAYKADEIKVPEELTKLEEVDFDDLLKSIFDGGKKDKAEDAAIAKAENVLAAAKTCFIEATAIDVDCVTKVGNTYHTTVKALVDAGELDSNPFDTNTLEDGGMTIMFDATTLKITSAIATGTIDGYELYYDATTGEFEAYKD